MGADGPIFAYLLRCAADRTVRHFLTKDTSFGLHLLVIFWRWEVGPRPRRRGQKHSNPTRGVLLHRIRDDGADANGVPAHRDGTLGNIVGGEL